ncbi:MAG TPA: D-Ala-D-Ala carboxypeptidase family metallohydrolase [Hyphomicrobiaceae bacterium]|jgi:hypothetical protein|nr:D-Ala-D-Ala carboxypeptidase family metallohydrolase [Hyphomicrobiaceae bacterium]
MYRRFCALKLVAPHKPRHVSTAGASSVLALAVFACGLGMKTPEALALTDENWINETIALGNGDTDRPRSRRVAHQRKWVERRVARDDDDDDDDTVRPQRHLYRAYRASSAENSQLRRHRTRVASLGRVAATVSEDSDEPLSGPTITARRYGKTRMASLRERHSPSRSATSRTARQKVRGTRVASLGRDFVAPSPSKAPSLSGGSIRWLASAGCLASSLRTVLEQVAANFGPLRVNSTCRSRRHNARVGGARHSYHLSGHAVDFRVSGSAGRVAAFLRRNGAVGGLKHYGHGLFHIDTGPRRSW